MFGSCKEICLWYTEVILSLPLKQLVYCPIYYIHATIELYDELSLTIQDLLRKNDISIFNNRLVTNGLFVTTHFMKQNVPLNPITNLL